MQNRVQELCRKLKPVLGSKIDRIWTVYVSESDPAGKKDIEQTLELLAVKYLKQDYQPDRSPFPPPSRDFACSGEIQLGNVVYADKEMYPFFLKGNRLKEHILISGRSGSGKTNLTFILMREILRNNIKVLALDWKRGYRDLLELHTDLNVYTIGRDVAPFRFNPLIPPAGCEPQVWIKLIVDVIANAYLGGEGVISLLVAGLDHLFRDFGVYDKVNTTWPTIQDLLLWLKKTKLKGRAAMWQASAERILLAMTYGEFGNVINCHNNVHVAGLLQENAVLEMDGLSSDSDRRMFSESLTLYLYRLRLAQGPQKKLTNMIILEEAHNLLHRKSSDSRESVLETSIRMIRQYGMGYVFVDQSASLISKVAFANSYATLALSQKLKSDVQTISSAMNLTDEQKEALNTLPIGCAAVRLADEHPEPFLLKVPLSKVKEGSISDEMVNRRFRTNHRDTIENRPAEHKRIEIPPIPLKDKKETAKQNNISHPPSPKESQLQLNQITDIDTKPPGETMTREEIRFLSDIVTHPLSTTVSRYQRLNFSRRRGNAIRQSLAKSSIIEPVPIATRSGQVMLYQLSDGGKKVCMDIGIEPGTGSNQSLEHRYWVKQAARFYEHKGYEVSREHPIGNGRSIDLLAQRSGEKIAIEIETGKSDIKANIEKISPSDFDKVIFIATSPAAIASCNMHKPKMSEKTQIISWLDIIL